SRSPPDAADRGNHPCRAGGGPRAPPATLFWALPFVLPRPRSVRGLGRCRRSPSFTAPRPAEVSSAAQRRRRAPRREPPAIGQPFDFVMRVGAAGAASADTAHPEVTSGEVQG